MLGVYSVFDVKSSNLSMYSNNFATPPDLLYCEISFISSLDRSLILNDVFELMLCASEGGDMSSTRSCEMIGCHCQSAIIDGCRCSEIIDRYRSAGSDPARKLSMVSNASNYVDIFDTMPTCSCMSCDNASTLSFI